MKTLLIVEDEKAIRMGLEAIVKRAPVEIGRVLCCANGVEALEILKAQPVDVMITDIRMPKMDGIELMRNAQALASPPLTVVVSGYDDFSYAVGMFRQGIRDYILKPVERERIFELLMRLDAELSEAERSCGGRTAVSRQVLRSLMLGAEPGEDEMRALEEQCEDGLLSGPYTAVCVYPGLEIQTKDDSVCVLPDMEGHDILFVRPQDMERLRRGRLAGCCFGISRSHSGLAQLRAAYREAVRARGFAFLRGSAEEYANLSAKQPSADVNDQLERIVQLLGISNAQGAQQALRDILFLAQNGKLEPEAFADAVTKLLGKIVDAYGTLWPICEELSEYGCLWRWNSAFEYYNALCGWIVRFCEQLRGMDENDNKEKIHSALVYLQENFRADINMATASNFVSMNYTQFSSLFKLYTGSNFLEYLKKLRLEESKRLLRATDIGIRQISRQAGFKNEKHFMKSFKQSMGVSPSDYRRNIQMAKPEVS